MTKKINIGENPLEMLINPDSSIRIDRNNNDFVDVIIIEGVNYYCVTKLIYFWCYWWSNFVVVVKGFMIHNEVGIWNINMYYSNMILLK